MDTMLYMFALMPTNEVSSYIQSRREELFERFGFSKALKPPVHITLYDPFHIKKESAASFENAVDQLQKWADSQPPFQIDLQDYGFFENPKTPVVYIDVKKTSKIKDLQANFIKKLKQYIATEDKPKTYKPHVTIGYRDITPDVFPAIKNYYSNQTFSASFACSTFYLWRHNGQNWQILKTFHLNGAVSQLSLF